MAEWLKRQEIEHYNKPVDDVDADCIHHLLRFAVSTTVVADAGAVVW